MSEQTQDQANGTAGFDLGAIDAVIDEQEHGYVIHLHDHRGEPMYFGPEGEEKPVTWTVAGEHSRLYREQERLVRDRFFKGRRRGSIGQEDIEEQHLELLSRVTLGFNGFVDNGQPVAFSREKAKEVLRKARWIRDQVDRGTADHAGLFRISSSS